MKATGPPLLAIVAFAILAVISVFGPLSSNAIASNTRSATGSNDEKVVAPAADHVKAMVEHNYFDCETVCATMPMSIDEFIAEPESRIASFYLRGRGPSLSRYDEEPPVETNSVQPGGVGHALAGVDLGH